MTIGELRPTRQSSRYTHRLAIEHLLSIKMKDRKLCSKYNCDYCDNQLNECPPLRHRMLAEVSYKTVMQCPDSSLLIDGRIELLDVERVNSVGFSKM